MGLLLVGHIVAIFTENINWDEFALLARAADTLRTGQLVSGGRPGLGVFLLIPFVDGCSDAVTAVRSARVLWTGIMVVYVAGFWCLLRRWLKNTPSSWSATALAVGLLVLVPVFLRSSIQVRTDQPALAFGLWGGIALLASRSHAPWALLAGLLFGVGFLFSQKLVYVGALILTLVVGRQVLDGEADLRRELIRAFCCAGVFFMVTGGFYLAVATWYDSDSVLHLGSGMDALRHYREMQPSTYWGMLPTLVPHLLLVGLGAASAAIPLKVRLTSRQQRVLPLLVLNVGGAVALFHTGAWPYFWMTLGLFPATGVALMYDAIRELLTRRWVQRTVLGVVWVVLLAAAIPAAVRLLRDTQAVQRDSMAFIHHNFRPSDQGFHPERALFCRHEPDPFPTYFIQNIRARFTGPDGEAHLPAFLAAFQTKPVAFVLDSYRLWHFPPEALSLFQQSFVTYYAAVRIPGRSVRGPVGTTATFLTHIPGTYRWFAEDDQQRATIRIGPYVLAHGDTVVLASGAHALELLAGTPGGFLSLAVRDLPGRRGEAFYSWAARLDFEPHLSPRWWLERSSGRGKRAWEEP